jgi:hypothetical protein
MMPVEYDELARASAIAFGRRLAERWQQVIGNDLLGLYLIGSLAHACFSRRYSDIDIALVTAAGLSPQARIPTSRRPMTSAPPARVTSSSLPPSHAHSEVATPFPCNRQHDRLPPDPAREIRRPNPRHHMTDDERRMVAVRIANLSAGSFSRSPLARGGLPTKVPTLSRLR